MAFVWLTLGQTGATELRMVGSERAVSALLTDGDHRILILNANGARDARAVVGRLNQPWEPDSSVLVASVARNNEEAIWEALQHTQWRQLVVLGIPGADPDWIAIERYCREQAVGIEYVRDITTLQTANALLTLVPAPGSDSGPTGDYLELRYGQLDVVVELTGHPQVGRHHLVVTNDAEPLAIWSSVRIIPSSADQFDETGVITLDAGDRVDAILDGDEIKLQGRAAESFQSR